MGKLTVLYVDDEPDLRDVSSLALQLDPDIEVYVAASGEEALSLLTSGACAPDVVLLDVMMPNLDGPGVLKQLRNDDRFLRLPVIFITARVREQEIAHLKSLGAAGVIAKPFDPMTLATDVRALFGG